MTSPLAEAIGRAALELGRESITAELAALRAELRTSPLAHVAGYAARRAKALRAMRPDGKLTPEDMAAIVDELPAIVRAARAAHEARAEGGSDGAR